MFRSDYSNEQWCQGLGVDLPFEGRGRHAFLYATIADGIRHSINASRCWIHWPELKQMRAELQLMTAAIYI